MVFTSINNSRERTLEALISGNLEKAKIELKSLAKKCYLLALAAKDEHVKRGLVYEGDIYHRIFCSMAETEIKEETKDEEKDDNKLPALVKNADIPKKWNPEPKPDITFDDIIGLEEAKKEIRLRMVVPYTNKKIAKSYGLGLGGGILLYGPPGTGKTTLARAVAGELDMPFFNLNSADILERSAEKTIENIRSIFEEAQKYDRSIMFFDEIELIVPVRPSSITMKHAVNEFLVSLDGFSSRKEGLLLMGATNRPWEIRPAILRPGRLSEKIYVGLPDIKAREQIFKLNLNELKISKDIDYAILAEATTDFSGADIEHACEKAGRLCLEYFTETGKQKPMQMDDFKTAIQETIPTFKRINPYDLKKLEEFRQEITKFI